LLQQDNQHNKVTRQPTLCGVKYFMCQILFETMLVLQQISLVSIFGTGQKSPV